jgi:hypothetical protein
MNMPDDGGAIRDLFEVDNAKALYPRQLAPTFVGTREFWRLLSPKNHIVLGSRGSGKTAIVKMLAHEYLSQFDHSHAKKAVRDASFIGVYIPLSLDWVGALKNKSWTTEAEAERMFQWRLNVAGCAAFLVSLESCLSTYRPKPGERAQSEDLISRQIASLWGSDVEANDIAGLRRYLRGLVASRGRAARAARAAEVEPSYSDQSNMDEDLFGPLKWAAEVASEELHFASSTAWLICIDEVELLRPFQQRVINTAIRSSSAPFFYKLATLPYGHYTIDTNAERQLEVGHDFEYVRIDRDPIHDADRSLSRVFVEDVYKKRQRLSPDRYPPATLEELFGPSRLLQPGRWAADDEFLATLRANLLPSSFERASALLARDRRAFDNEIRRRLRATLELREAAQSHQGHWSLDLYSGAQLFLRCTDGNPRLMIRLFKAMLDKSPQLSTKESNRRRVPIIPTTVQTEVMMAISSEALLRARAQEGIGFDVYGLVNAIGRFANATTYADRISTDAVTTVRVDSGVDDRTWQAVMKACDLGLLYASVTWNNPDQWPMRSGFFHLAYVLAPHFRIMPRRGRARRLSLILQDSIAQPIQQTTLFEFNNDA